VIRFESVFAYRNAAAMTLSLTCLLGITWLSGFFLYTDAIAFAYIFTITNGLQVIRK